MSESDAPTKPPGQQAKQDVLEVKQTLRALDEKLYNMLSWSTVHGGSVGKDNYQQELCDVIALLRLARNRISRAEETLPLLHWTQ
jgi:hypothetical protein